MDMIETLLKFVAKMCFGIALAVLAWWLVALLFPALSFNSLIALSSKNNGDWLPAPRNITNLLGSGKVPPATDNVYVPGPAYNGVANSPKGSADVNFISYDTDGRQTIQTNNPTTTVAVEQYGSNIPTVQKSRYLRNLSIYDGQSIHTGSTFFGEAKDTFFSNGRFPVIILNPNGQVVAINYAEATTNWAIPGWVRFQVKINSVLPRAVPCTMIFQSANHIASQQVKVAMPIVCN
jgi:hypothetical protein